MTKKLQEDGSGIDKTVLKSAVKQQTVGGRVSSSSAGVESSVNVDEQTVLTSKKPPSTVSGYDLIRVGSIIKGRFRLKKRLGEGGMGCVYLAEDKLKLEAKSPDPFVAIKILSGDFQSHPAAFVSLQRETQKSQQLAHPNIITAYDFDRDDTIVYMTMEALRGDDLDQHIYDDRDRQVDIQLASDIVTAISSGLAYAHSKGVIHSDLKPANIFLTDQNVVKILDFGIARSASDGSSQVVDGFDAGALGALTPTYASCEMFEGGDPTPGDDIYALGIIAYQLFSGQHPFNKATSVEARDKGLKPKRLKNVNRHQWRAISSALLFDPAKRIKSSAEFEKIFKGPSKLKRSIWALAVTLMVVSGYFFYHLNYVVTVQVNFDDLSEVKQAEFRDQMEQAKISDNFGDENAALFHLNNAFIIHPYNNAVMTRLNEIIDEHFSRDINKMGRKELSDFSYHVDTLLQYEALTDNTDLRDLKRRIDARITK